jgi:hypothetical protein
MTGPLLGEALTQGRTTTQSLGDSAATGSVAVARWLAEAYPGGREWLCWKPGRMTMAGLMCRVG